MAHTPQHPTAQYPTAQHPTAQHPTAQHPTEPYHILAIVDPSTPIGSTPIGSTPIGSTLARLQQEGVAAIEYQTTASAMQFELVLQQRPWDLIICAYVDAPLATIDLLQLTLRLRPQTPVIIVGEQVPPRVAFELGRLGAQEFIDAADTHRLLASVQQMAIAKRAAPVARSPILGVAARTPAQQLMQVLTSLQDALMSISLPDRQLLFVSASFERVFGYPVETLLKDEEFYKQVVHPEDAARVEVARAAAVREGYAEVEHRVRWPNGEVRWLRRRAWLNYDADGKPVQLIDTARDITAHKRIEEKLQAADDKQRAILNSIPDLMFHIHGNGTILDFHGRETDLFIPLEAIIGKNVREFLSHSLIPAESVAQALDAIQLAATQGQARLFDYTLPDQHHYEARILPIEGRDEVILMIRDITDRKRTEVKLRESEERYRSLVESTDGIIAVFDADGATLYANAVAARPFGLTPQQMVGKAYTELFPPDIAARQLADIRAVIQHTEHQRPAAKADGHFDVSGSVGIGMFDHVVQNFGKKKFRRAALMLLQAAQAVIQEQAGQGATYRKRRALQRQFNRSLSGVRRHRADRPGQNGEL